MHRNDDIDVINARKALEKICENNTKFTFEQDDYDSVMTVTNVRPLSGDAGIVFNYCSNGMHMSVAISDKINQIVISIELKEKHEWFWYYKEYQRLHKLVQNTLLETKNKTK
jgi:hypothetical protein